MIDLKPPKVIELKPCFLCGGNAKLDTSTMGTIIISCPRCNLTVCQFTSPVKSETIDELIIRWNRRVSPWRQWPLEKPRRSGIYVIFGNRDLGGGVVRIEMVEYCKLDEKWIGKEMQEVTLWQGEPPEPHMSTLFGG